MVLSLVFSLFSYRSLLGFNSVALEEERCVRGKCFEWSIISYDTTMKHLPTNGVWSKPDGGGPFTAMLIAVSCGGGTLQTIKCGPVSLRV